MHDRFGPGLQKGWGRGVRIKASISSMKIMQPPSDLAKSRASLKIVLQFIHSFPTHILLINSLPVATTNGNPDSVAMALAI